MAELFKDAFQSMDLSTEKLTDVLNVAKQSDAKKLNDRELRQIEELLRKLSDSFDLFSVQDIMQTKVARGEFTGQKEKLEEIAQQYQQMEALIANMTQTLMGLESVRNRFSQLHGSYATLLSSLEKSQKTSAASRLKLTQFSLNQTKDTVEKATEHFKRQLLDLMTLYEVLGAQYFQMAAAASADEYSDEHPEPPAEEPNDENSDENAEQTSAETEQDTTEQAEDEQQAAEQAEAEQLAADELAAQELAEQQAAEQAQAEQLAADELAAQELAEQQAAEQAQAEQLTADELAAQELAEQQAAEQAEQLAADELAAQELAEQQAAEQAEAEQLAADELAAQELAEQQAAEQAEAEQLAADELAAQELAEQQAAEQLTAMQMTEQAERGKTGRSKAPRPQTSPEKTGRARKK